MGENENKKEPAETKEEQHSTDAYSRAYDLFVAQSLTRSSSFLPSTSNHNCNDPDEDDYIDH